MRLLRCVGCSCCGRRAASVRCPPPVHSLEARKGALGHHLLLPRLAMPGGGHRDGHLGWLGGLVRARVGLVGDGQWLLVVVALGVKD